MKMRNKIFWLIIIWAVTYPLGWVIYPFWWKYDFAQIFGWNFFYTSFSVGSWHVIGYSVLGFFFGWLAMLLAILDEPIQCFVKSKAFSLVQMGLNIGSTFLGMWISKYIKISWRGKS